MPLNPAVFRFLLRSFLYLTLFITPCILILLLSGCQSNKNGKPNQQITISGSTTILPLSEHWAMEFKKQTGIIVNVQGGGSTNGIISVKNQTVEIGASSRNLSESEKENLQLIEIGKDALVVILNPKNQIKNLNTNQLRQIFAGEITNWKELGGEDRTIQVINREAGSGSRSTFEELIMCASAKEKKGLCYEMHLSAIVLNSNSEVKHSVELIEDSIGYISYGFLDKKVKPLNLNSIQPTESEIRSGNYPISRSLYYVTLKDHNSASVSKYLQFVLSPKSQYMLSSEGFLPTKE